MTWINIVSIVMGWEIGRFLYKKLKFFVLERQGRTKKISYGDGTMTITGSPDWVKKITMEIEESENKK